MDNKSEFWIEASCRINYLHGKPDGQNQISSQSLVLPDKMYEIFKDTYYNQDGTLTSSGIEFTTMCFIEGLISNIHYSYKKGMGSDHEYLKEIIRALELGLVRTTEFIQTKKETE